MRIARLCTMDHPVPPISYGGPQSVAALLSAYQACTGGHDVSLYAPADSDIINYTKKIASQLGLRFKVSGNKITVTNADGKEGSVELCSIGQKAIGSDNFEKPFLEVEGWSHTKLAAKFMEDHHKAPYDIIELHDKSIYRSILAGREDCKGRLLAIAHDPPAVLNSLYDQFPYPIVTLTKAQKEAYIERKPNVNIVGVVHNSALPFMKPCNSPAGYLAWLGRITPEKGVDEAIKIARKAGKPLLIGGTVFNQEYFDTVIKPNVDRVDSTLLDKLKDMTPEQIKEALKDNPVIYVGPVVNDKQKEAFLGKADATLFPSKWREPFGLVQIESMSVGTPVIGFSRIGDRSGGSVSEIIEDGGRGIKSKRTISMAQLARQLLQ